MAKVNVSVPAILFTDTIYLLRDIIDDHTETVEGTMSEPEHDRCTVCSCAIKRYATEHRASDHCQLVSGKLCWVSHVVHVLNRLLS